MFCDLVGSTELANAVDPEEMGALLRRFQEASAGAIARFDGFVAKFMGDSVLAYFGYPRAHEDAVGQSVRAASAIIEKVAQTKRPDGRPLEVRAGIATGLVVIGDLVGVESRANMRLSARRPISRRAFRHWRIRVPSSSARRRINCSEGSSSRTAAASMR